MIINDLHNKCNIIHILYKTHFYKVSCIMFTEMIKNIKIIYIIFGLNLMLYKQLMKWILIICFLYTKDIFS